MRGMAPIIVSLSSCWYRECSLRHLEHYHCRVCLRAADADHWQDWGGMCEKCLNELERYQNFPRKG